MLPAVHLKGIPAHVHTEFHRKRNPERITLSHFEKQNYPGFVLFWIWPFSLQDFVKDTQSKIFLSSKNHSTLLTLVDHEAHICVIFSYK